MGLALSRLLTDPKLYSIIQLRAQAHASLKDTATQTSVIRECNICFGSFPEEDMCCARASGSSASTSKAAAVCGHFACADCMGAYVRSKLDDRKYPLVCPSGAPCRRKLGAADVDKLLAAHPAHVEILQQLQVQHAIGAADSLYCPHKDCSALLMKSLDEDLDQQPSECPECHRAFCAACKITGWHEGYTCKEFQALPPHMRSAEDAALLKLSERRNWKQCPSCGVVVEREEGCNHMRCRCGTGFCYKCGVKYRSDKPTRRNVHGEPGCDCSLFEVPDEPPVRQRENRQPANQHQPAHRAPRAVDPQPENEQAADRGALIGAANPPPANQVQPANQAPRAVDQPQPANQQPANQVPADRLQPAALATEPVPLFRQYLSRLARLLPFPHLLPEFLVAAFFPGAAAGGAGRRG